MHKSDQSYPATPFWKAVTEGCFFVAVAVAGFFTTAAAVAQEAQPPAATQPAAVNRTRADLRARLAASPHAQTQPAGVVQTQPAGPPPKFRCDEQEYLFDEVWAGSTVEHEFIIHNDGEGELQILAVQPTCGCTVAEYDKTIPPGGQGKIKAAMRTANYAGDMHKSINVTTNDPAQQRVVLWMKGKVKKRISEEPRLYASWGPITPETELVKTFKLTNNTDVPMKLELVEPTVPIPFKAAIKEIESGKVVELTITAVPPFRDGNNSGQIQIKTGIQEEPQLNVPCSLYKPPPVVVSPTPFRLPVVPLTQPWKRPITVQYNLAGEMKILSAESSDPEVKVEVTPTEPGKQYTLMLDFPQGYAPDAQSPPNVTIKTDYEESPTITVPIVAVRRQAPGTPTTPTAQTPPHTLTPETLVGRSAPVAVVLTPEGGRVRIGAGTNQIQVLNFWASWDPASHGQLPVIKDLFQSYQRKGVTFLNLNVDQLRPTDEITDVARQLDVKVPIGLDRQHQIARAYGVTKLPVLFVIGQDGTVQAAHSGAGRTAAELQSLSDAVQKELDLLLEGKTRTDFPPVPTMAGLVSPIEAVPTGPVPPSTPLLAVEAFRQEAGLLKPGAPAEYKLYYRNEGQASLEIKSISGGEGLQIDPDYTKTLALHETGVAKCTFTTPAKPQAFAHLVTIETNDVLRPKTLVTVTGRSRPWIEIDPPTGIDFSNRARTHSVPRIATLVYNGPGEVKYGEPKSSSPKFEAELRPTRQSSYTMLIVKTVAPLDLGENNAIIRVETDCKEQPVVEVPVALYLPPRIEITPPIVTLLPGPTAQKATVSITNHGDSPLSIFELKRSNPGIRTQFYPEPDGMSYKLVMTFPPPPTFVCDAEGEKVTLRTDDSEFGTVEIPIKLASGAPEPKSVSQRP